MKRITLRRTPRRRTPAEVILLALLAIATGALLMPSENQRTTRELLDDDIEIGVSTATRHIRK